MTPYSIPLVQTLPWYAFSIALSGAQYTLEPRFNSRRDRWMLTILDAADQVLVAGIPLALGRDLLAPFRSLAVPPGILFVDDDTGRDLPATAASFLTDHTLYYVEDI